MNHYRFIRVYLFIWKWCVPQNNYSVKKIWTLQSICIPKFSLLAKKIIKDISLYKWDIFDVPIAHFVLHGMESIYDTACIKELNIFGIDSTSIYYKHKIEKLFHIYQNPK